MNVLALSSRVDVGKLKVVASKWRILFDDDEDVHD